MITGKKNGKVELLRFLFALSILFYHLQLDAWDNVKKISENMTFFLKGKNGVEFFFLVTGFLMAKSIHKSLRQEALDPSCAPDSLGEETVSFLWRKVKAVLPYHIPYCIITVILLYMLYPSKMPLMFFERFPSLFFLNSTGIMADFSSFLSVEWYISSMLIALAVVYPLCKRFWKDFGYLIAPLSALLILGYINFNVGQLPGNTKAWNGVILYVNLRAFADICLGVTCYFACLSLKKYTFTTWKKGLLSLLEAICYFSAFRYYCSSASDKFQVYILLILCVGITLSFSQQGLFGHSILFQNRFCCFLGNISLPIYLGQNIIRIIANKWMYFSQPRQHVLAVTVMTLGLGTVSWLIWTAICRQQAHRRQCCANMK